MNHTIDKPHKICWYGEHFHIFQTFSAHLPSCLGWKLCAFRSFYLVLGMDLIIKVSSHCRNKQIQITHSFFTVICRIMSQHAPSSGCFIPIGSQNNLHPPDGEWVDTNKAHRVQLEHVRFTWVAIRCALLQHPNVSRVVWKSPSMMSTKFIRYGKPVRCVGPAGAVWTVASFPLWAVYENSDNNNNNNSS